LNALVTEGQFLALQMVNFLSLHDEERPADVFYHYRRDTLVNALQMDVLPLILGVIFHFFFGRRGLAGSHQSQNHTKYPYKNFTWRRGGRLFYHYLNIISSNDVVPRSTIVIAKATCYHIVINSAAFFNTTGIKLTEIAVFKIIMNDLNPYFENPTQE
jgi:hypothetical protein